MSPRTDGVVPIDTHACGIEAFAVEATDGITVVSGGKEGNAMLLGSLAAEVMAVAVLCATRAATGIPGLPAARDFG